MNHQHNNFLCHSASIAVQARCWKLCAFWSWDRHTSLQSAQIHRVISDIDCEKLGCGFNSLMGFARRCMWYRRCCYQFVVELMEYPMTSASLTYVSKLRRCLHLWSRWTFRHRRWKCNIHLNAKLTEDHLNEIKVSPQFPQLSCFDV